MKSYKWLNPFLFILPSNKISSNQNEPDTRSCCTLLTASYSSKQFYIASSEWSFSIFPSLPSEWLWHCSVCSFSLRGLGCPQFELITRSFQTPLFYKQEHNLITDFLICLLAERSGLRTWNNITWSFFLICIFFFQVTVYLVQEYNCIVLILLFFFRFTIQNFRPRTEDINNLT